MLVQNKEKYLTNIEWNDDMLATQYQDKIKTFGSLEYPEENLKFNKPSQNEIIKWKDLYNDELRKIAKIKGDVTQKHIDFIFDGKLSVNEIKYVLDNYKDLIKNKKDDYYNIFFDFETYADKKKNKTHIAYLCRYVTEDGVKNEFYGNDCATQMLNSLPTNKKNIQLIAHNCGYDFLFIFKELQAVSSIIMNGSNFMSASCVYENKTSKWNLKMKDSYKIIPEALSKFGKMFNLEQGKEVIPYKLYNKVFSKYGMEKIWYGEEYVYEEVVKECGIKNLQQFKDNCIKWDCILEGEINIMEYSNKYCEIDCDVLMNGYNIFNGWIKNLGENSIVKVDLDINNIISVASLAHTYLTSQGCYENILQLSGKPREYIQKCVVGGRTMCNQNKKWKRKNARIADFDAVSLYPSAIYQMIGFLMGKPKVIENTDLEWCLKQDGIFARCIIKKLSVKRHFPLGSYMLDGVRNFTNDIIGKEMYLDKQSILDLMEFQGVELEIIDGYYYNEGRNPICKDVIKYLFETRKQKKKEGNPIQSVYKLIMNSAYGKTILKPISDKTEVINKFKYDKKEKKMINVWNRYLTKQYNYIKSYVDCGNKVIVNKHVPITEHFNNAHVGVEVLSKSKNIMNKVMCLAEDLKLKIYTQDTDSMHIDFNEVAILAEEYKNKYDFDLIGIDMGQFHIDFDLEGAVGDIWATYMIILGKKCYIDKLESRDKDGNPIYGYHIRMKGVNRKSIDYTSKLLSDDGSMDYMGLYEKLYDGDKIAFDLLCGGEKDIFRNTGDMCIRTLNEGEFTRNVIFNYEEGEF